MHSRFESLTDKFFFAKLKSTAMLPTAFLGYEPNLENCYFAIWSSDFFKLISFVFRFILDICCTLL